MVDDELLRSILNRSASAPQLVEENSGQSGYNIVRAENRFFAVHQRDGAFDIDRVRRKEYTAPVFEADTLGEMQDLLKGLPGTPELRGDHLLKRVRLLESVIDDICRFVPPGHYYSPVNSEEDVRTYARYDRNAITNIPGVIFNVGVHTAHLQIMIDEYGSLPEFPKSKMEGLRYYYDNGEQWYFDAMAMRHFVRTCSPKRIIEIGGGYSTAVMMDAAEACGIRTHFTVIEPDPVRLLALLRAEDLSSNRLIKDKVQNIELELFDQLAAGDILFIDSSHVSKFHSDVNHYMFEILPRIKAGVFVHIHDIDYPFDYSSRMLEEGRSWNEAYVLRAFLMYNASFRIEFWSAYASHFQGELIADKMPLCRQWPGGAFWLSRI